MFRLSEELIIEIAYKLDPISLMSMELTNKQLRINLQYDKIWLKHVYNVWLSTRYIENIPTICPLLERIRRVCSIQLLKKALKPYQSQSGGNLIEKMDYMLLLRTKLLFRTRIANNQIPQWTQKINDGKAAFIYSRIEIKRTKSMFESEITTINWHFRFKEQGHEGEAYEAKFFTDHTLISQFHPDQSMHWETHSGVDGKFDSIQVEHFPRLTFSRAHDGRWEMHNNHVIFEQVSGSGHTADEIRLCE